MESVDLKMGMVQGINTQKVGEDISVTSSVTFGSGNTNLETIASEKRNEIPDNSPSDISLLSVKTLDEMYYAGLLHEGMTEEEKEKTLAAQFNHILRSLTAKSTHIISKLMDKEREKEGNRQLEDKDKEAQLIDTPDKSSDSIDMGSCGSQTSTERKLTSGSFTGKLK